MIRAILSILEAIAALFAQWQARRWAAEERATGAKVVQSDAAIKAKEIADAQAAAAAAAPRDRDQLTDRLRSGQF